MSLLIGPHVKDATLIETFSKNENNASSQRIKCPCGNFLGSLGQFNPIEAPWKGCRIVKCEELKVLSAKDTLEFFRRIKRDPNGLADKKGCGRILIFSQVGQVIRVVAPGNEDHTKLAAALDAIRAQKENEARLTEWRKQQEGLFK